jgi:processive 1,2-diacylglycerol beta-glucosyltransferase
MAIPVLTAGFGEGHNAAARAVAEALGRLDPEGGPAAPRDLFEEAYGPVRFARQRRLYLDLANRAPWLWAGVYHALDRLPLVRLGLPFLGPVARRLDDVLAARPPVVVTTYPLYPHLIARRFREDDPARPFVITVVTDSLSVNRVWHGAPSDVWVAPNAPTAGVLLRQGAPASRVRALGFPVDRRLRAPAAGPGPRPRVLLMLNPGRRDAVPLARAVAACDVDLTVTVGRDADFRSAVESALGGRATVVGWTDRLPELMLGHDLILTKAGGATTHEAVAANIPLVFTQVIPGQEAGNARLVVEGGGGAYGLTPAAAAEAVRAAFADGRRTWDRWRRALASLGDPLGADRVASLALEAAQARRASSPATRAAS